MHGKFYSYNIIWERFNDKVMVQRRFNYQTTSSFSHYMPIQGSPSEWLALKLIYYGSCLTLSPLALPIPSPMVYIISISLACFFIGHCKYFSFHCNNNKCISDSMTCNGRDDCGDNSDENTTPCLPGKFTSKQYDVSSSINVLD